MVGLYDDNVSFDITFNILQESKSYFSQSYV